MDFSWWSALFGAFGIGVLKLIWDIVKHFLNKRDKESEADREFQELQGQIESLFTDLLTGSVGIQELIENFLHNNQVDRIYIMRMENGGGIPQLGTEQHISVLYEAYRVDTIEPMKTDFQNYAVDAAYQKLLMEVVSDKYKILRTEDMDDGMLKKVYEAHGITKSIKTTISHIPSLGETKTNGFMIYMSVQFKDDRVIDAKIETDIAILRDKIAQIFHDFYVKRVTLFK